MAGTLLAASAMAADRPNILIYFVDDMGYGDCRVYTTTSPVPMPNVEALAEAGMTFMDAHTSAALCAPTRYSILSGNYSWRGRNELGTWHFNGNSTFLDGQKTIAAVLQENGYHTAMFGKSHLGGLVYPKDTNAVFNTENKDDNWIEMDFTRALTNGPAMQGFDYTFLPYNGIQGRPYAYFENDLLVGDASNLFVWAAGDYTNANGVSEIMRDGFGMPDWKSNETGPILTQTAIDFIDRHHSNNVTAGTRTPFFIHYCSQGVHKPHTPPISFMGEPVQGVTGVSAHLDMLYEVDHSLGRILQALDTRGLLTNTLVIFTSDNGGLTESLDLGHNSNEGLRENKGSIYEGGHRVPFIVRWGDGTPEESQIPPGTTSQQLIGVHDIFATLAELTGSPHEPGHGLDSRSFLSVLLDQNEEPIHDTMLLQSGSEGPHRALREGGWKLITAWGGGGALHLYNLAEDLPEETDRVHDATQTERIERMLAKIDEILLSYRSTPCPLPMTQLAHPPADISGSNLQSDTNVYLFTEKALRLESDLSVDVVEPRGLSMTSMDAIPVANVSSGTVVQSHLIHFLPNSNGTYGGTWQFEEPITGLIFDDRPGRAGLESTDVLLGLDTVTYPGTNDARACIVERGDQLWVSDDGRSLSVTLMGPVPTLTNIPIDDPGFETMTEITVSTSPWYSGGETNPAVDEIYIDSTYARTGTNCVGIGVQNDASTLNQNLAEPLDTEATYLFEGWVRTLPGKPTGSVTMRILSGPARNVVVKTLTFKIRSPDWSQCLINIRPEDFPDTVSTGDPIRLRFSHGAGNAMNGVLLDDVSLIKIKGESTGGIDEMRVLTPVPASQDTDDDDLGDAWEYHYFGDLTPEPDDPAPQGAGTLLGAYAYGLNPFEEPASPIKAVWNVSETKPCVVFTRAKDSRLNWTVHLSDDLQDNWDTGAEGVDYTVAAAPGRHHFTENVTLEILRPFSGQIFVRTAFETAP